MSTQSQSLFFFLFFFFTFVGYASKVVGGAYARDHRAQNREPRRPPFHPTDDRAPSSFPLSRRFSHLGTEKEKKKSRNDGRAMESCVSLRWTREVACRGSRCGQGGKTRFKPRLGRVDDLVRVPVPATSSSLSSLDRRQISVLLIDIYIFIYLSIEISIENKSIYRMFIRLCFHRWKVVRKILR